MRTCSEFSTKEKMCLLWKSSKFSSFLLVSYVIHCVSFFFPFFFFVLAAKIMQWVFMHSCTHWVRLCGCRVFFFLFSFFLPIYSYNIIVQNFFCLLKSVWESCSVCPPKKAYKSIDLSDTDFLRNFMFCFIKYYWIQYRIDTLLNV